MKKREIVDLLDSSELEQREEVRYKTPTKEDMERLQKLVGRRLANFGILSNLGLGDYGTVAGRVFVKDLRLRIWRDIILEEAWTAEYAQRVAAGIDEAGAEDAQGVAEVAELLATDNLLWQRWWNHDFANFRLDIGPSLPPWVMELSRQDNSPDDERLQKVYGNVPWRRYYAWCQYFQRRCAKLILKLADRRAARFVENFVLPPDVPVGVLVYEPAEAVEWALHPDEPDMALYRFDDEAASRVRFTGFNDTMVTNENGEVFREMSLSEIAFDKQPSDQFEERKGSPILAWILLNREVGFGSLGDPEAIEGLLADLLPIRLGEMREPVPSARRRARYVHNYTFNFDALQAAKFVTAFMMWYELEFSERVNEDLIEEPTDREGVPYMMDRPSGLGLARQIGYVNNADKWTVFAELPLAPTRDGVRFIGSDAPSSIDEEEHVHSLVDSVAPGCLLCCSIGQSMMRERAFPDLVFCSKECHREFRTAFPVKMKDTLVSGTVNGDGEEEARDARFFEQMDTLYPILLRLRPASLVAVSQASELAGQLFVDPRFRVAYVRARYADMRVLVQARVLTPGIMEDWFTLVLDHEATGTDTIGMMAQMAAPLCGRDNILRAIVSHPKFAAISGTYIDGLYWLAISACGANVRVLVESGYRVKVKPGPRIQSILRQAATLDKPDVVEELLKSNDPGIVVAYTLVLAAYVIAADGGSKGMPNAKRIFDMLLADRRFPEDRKEALRQLYIGRLKRPSTTTAGGRN